MRIGNAPLTFHVSFIGIIDAFSFCRSVGVLAYVMLSGCSPFAGDNNQETFLNISQVNLDFPDDLFRSTSSEAIDFIKKLLLKEPESVY